MDIMAKVPLEATYAERLKTDAELRRYLAGLAESAMEKEAKTRGRKVGEYPRMVDVVESRITPAIIYIVFQAKTVPA